MKIALVRPTVNTAKHSFFAFSFPTGLAGLASYLKQFNIEVEIWDYDDNPGELANLPDRIRESKPDIIGVSCMTPTIIRGGMIADTIKSVNPSIMVLVGGHHSTALPERTLNEFPSFDAVVVGEGEETLLEICQKMVFKDVKGVVYRGEDGNIIRNAHRPLIKDLDSLPFPDRSYFNLHKKRKLHFSRGLSEDSFMITDVYSSRGCPNICTFCAVNFAHSTEGIKYRMRSVENVLMEVRECKEKYGFNHISFMDDTLTINKQRVIQMCEGLKKIGLKSWNCCARVNTVDKEMLKALVDAGCRKISFGVESGSDKVLKQMKKGITVDQVRRAFAMSRELGLDIAEGTFMVGGAIDETPEDVDLTIKLIKEIKPDYISASVLVPFPGTEAHKQMAEKGYIFSENWEDYLMLSDKPQWRTTYFSPEDLVKMQKKILTSYYLSPGYILKRLTHLKNPGELKYLMRMGLSFLDFFYKRKDKE